MRATGVRVLLVAASCAALLAPEARATTTLQMNLDQLSSRAARVFRGTVLSAKPGSVEVGGGQLPVVTYRVRVDEAFKGTFDEVKAGTNVVEIRMVAATKGGATSGGARHLSAFRDMPQLTSGREYVLFVTAPSTIGLSTTVGLAQGLFGIHHQGKDEAVVNGVGNVGLFRGMAAKGAAAPGLAASSGRSPMSYSDFAQAIRASVASGSGKE